MRFPLFCILLTLTLLLPGCGFFRIGEAGSLTATSHDNPDVRLDAGFDRAIYALNDNQSITALLIAGPTAQPERVVTLRVFWTPRAGRTPVSRQATNTAIEVMVFADRPAPGPRELGLYAGAGYVYLRDQPGERLIQGEVWDADLLLRDQSLGFRDRLGRTNLTGRIQLQRDDQAVRETLTKLRHTISQTLEYPRLVIADQTPPAI
ncbi:hypothetical protein [Mucisphaera sp.]|uniref:hypothetical protein n=1 Tax=Mucisphaera sp. TaxID=2913024 RepID=UPI003D0A4779